MTIGALVNQGRVRWLGAILSAAVCAIGLSTAWAVPKARFQIDQKGDIILIGNTLGQECKAMDSKGMAIPKPVVGDVDSCGDQAMISDSAPDALWQSDATGNGGAQANDMVFVANARSTAMLSLPTGAKVTYARLYWGGNLTDDGMLAASPVTIERPGAGGFSIMVRPDPLKGEVATAVGGGSGNVYQSTAEITATVAQYGSGAYRVGNVVRRTVANRDEDVQFAAWSMVIIYQSNIEPVRNIAIFDGMDTVSMGQSVDLSIRGYNIPAGGMPQGKLGIIAYDGDSDKTESFTFNGQLLQDAQNPSNNLFNSTRSTLGMPVSVVGDLPQLTGGPASMSGLDLDILDISTLVMPGASAANIHASAVDDVYFLGALVTSIRSHKPVLETTLLADPAGVSPNDTVLFTSTTKNTGDDDGTDIVIRHPLPDGLTYVPGSIWVQSGPDQAQNGLKTDEVGDDQAELGTDPMTGKPALIIRIGKGASGTQGGTLTPTDMPVVVTYKLKTTSSANGTISTQSQTSGTPASSPALGSTSFPSSNGVQPGASTVVFVLTDIADIRVDVIKDPLSAPRSTPTSFHVVIKNVGDSPDLGPLKVTFVVPLGDMIDKLTPGPDWTCTQQDRTILCIWPRPLQPTEKTTAVDVVVRSPASPITDNQITVSVRSDGAIDPRLEDNVWTDHGGNLRLVGGGFSCSFSQMANLAGLWGLSAAVLLLWALSRQQKRNGAVSRSR